MKNSYLFQFVLSILILSSCSRFDCERGKGSITSSEKSISSFSDLKVSGDFEVILKQGDNYTCTVMAYENLHDIIEVRNSGRALKVNTRKCAKSDEKIKIYVSAPDISYIHLTGAVKAYTENNFKLEDLKLKSSGASSIELAIETKKLDIDISGASDVKLIGITKALTFDVSGAGHLNASQLKANSANISISGSGDCSVNVVEVLKASVSGSGNVNYTGSPSKVDTKISGSGNISKLDS